MNIKENLAARIESKEAVICVVGLGYVGLPLLIEFGRAGYNVLGLDIDQKKSDHLMAGESYFLHIPSEPVKELLDNGLLEATTDFSKIGETDAVLICVPTPLDKHMNPDLSFVTRTAKAIAPHLHQGHLVVLESTTYPGTTDEVLRPLLERDDFIVGHDFFLAFSPEREDPGNRDYSLGKIPKIVGGVTPESTELAGSLYSKIAVDAVLVSNADTAEAVKLTENIFRAVNIALVNELKMVYQRMGIDIWQVIEGAATKPFGYMPFYPGPGLGGHCIPIDPFYLTWRAKEFGTGTRFIELAGEINRDMPLYVINCLGKALNENRKCFNDSRILIIGMAYKRDVDDMRESPSLVLYELLTQRGAIVDYYDPYVPSIPPTREHSQLTGIKSIEWDAQELGDYEAVLISTDHSVIDYVELVRHAKLVVDTRNATAGVVEGREKIFQA